MVLKRIVTGVQALTIAVVVASLVLLVVRQPPAPAARAPSAGVDVSAATPDGKALYLAHCAACHGDVGDGTYAPELRGGKVAAKFPDIRDEVAVVVNGVDGTPMRAFGPKLTPAEIQAVVEHTRTL